MLQSRLQQLVGFPQYPPEFARRQQFRARIIDVFPLNTPAASENTD
jgi:hypothetical protein